MSREKTNDCPEEIEEMHKNMRFPLYFFGDMY